MANEQKEVAVHPTQIEEGPIEATAVQQTQTAATSQQAIAQLPEVKEAYLAPWHMNPETQARANKNNLYEVLDAGAEDIAKVFAAYQHAPVPRYSIRAVRVIYNPTLDGAFGLNLDLLEQRHRQAVFNPPWRNEGEASGAWRQQTHKVLEDMAAPYFDLEHPHIKLLPVWHTTQREILDSLFRVGFANLSLVDPGFFGAGIYSAGEAAYSYGVYHRLYKNPVLLVNWVATYSAYPVIHGDMEKLAGKGVKARYDAHFIPVRPKTDNPNEMNFYPCAPGEQYQYTELAVFEKAQCLPRYVVELQSDDIPLPLTPAENSPNALNAGAVEEKKQASSQFGGAVNFFQVMPQNAMGILHKQSMLHTQFGQLQLNRYALLQRVAEIAKKEIHDTPSCLAFIKQLEGMPGAPALKESREIYERLTTLESQIAQTHQQLSALAAQTKTLPEAEKVMMQTPAEEKTIAEENKLRQSVLSFTDAMQDFLLTQKDQQWDPGAHMQFVATVVSSIVQGPAVYNQRMDDPTNSVFSKPVAKFIRSYVQKNPNLWELRNHRDFADKLKRHLIKGDMQALKAQFASAVEVAQDQSKDNPQSKDKSCVMS